MLYVCVKYMVEHLVCENLLNLHPLSMVCAFSLYQDILRAFRVCLTLLWWRWWRRRR